jgi:hypothetical protein
MLYWKSILSNISHQVFTLGSGDDKKTKETQIEEKSHLDDALIYKYGRVQE